MSKRTELGKSRVLVIGYLCMVMIPGLACAQQEEDEVPGQIRSNLRGQLTIRTEVDPTTDYRGFEVLVTLNNDGMPDTLGYAVTDSTGHFSMDIVAPERGIYALVISRRGQILKVEQLAVAHGDSATVEAAFPVGARRLRIRSLENAGWLAYQNTRTQHEQALVELVGEGYDEESVGRSVAQTSMILWGLQESFPGTMGGEMAAAEAVVIGSGWDDSLTVARARAISPSNTRYGSVGRFARQAQARLAGQAAALALLDEFRAATTREDHRAELASERVLAHLDSLEYDDAIAAAEAMQEEYAEGEWGTWAERALYEMRNLLPGMEAPAFASRDAQGDSLRLADFLGKHVILEFYRPEDDVYQRELEGRNMLLVELGDELAIVSISLQPDTLINEAFFEERVAPGRHIYGGEDLADLYNVNVLPTRVLIDPEGRVVSKYVGGSLAALYEFMLTNVTN